MFYCTMREKTMGARDLRRVIAILAAGILLVAPGDSYGAGPESKPARRKRPLSRTTQPFRTSPPTSPAPLPDTADLSSSPDNAAAQDNTAASAGEEMEIREPSFGGESPAPAVSDPIEPVNRGIFYVNDKLYRWVLKPVAKGTSSWCLTLCGFPCATSS